MVIVLKQDISQDEKQNLKDFLSAKNFRLNEIVGEEETIIAAVGKSCVDSSELESMPGISRVIPISKPYKMSSREFKKENTVVEIPNSRGQVIRIGGQRVVVIAGLGTENAARIMDMAESLAASGASLFYVDAYKSSFAFDSGSAEEKLRIAGEASEKFGLPLVCRILSESHIPLIKKYADVLLVDCDSMRDHDFLRKIASTGKPVILKRARNAGLEEFLMSAETLLSSGCGGVVLCEHGIKTFEPGARAVLDLSAVPVLRSMTHLPVIVDPCNLSGQKKSVQPLGLASISVGADGVVVDVHPESEVSQQTDFLSPAQFNSFMHDMEAMTPVLGKAVAHIRTSAREKIVCAYSGKRGAYAEQAVGRFFDSSDVTALALDSFSEIFQAVVDGKADYGMVPIENSLAGSVYQNYDNFCRFEDVTIVGAITLNIRHALLGVRGACLDDIKTVYSHPQGFGQCKKFLDRYKAWLHVDSVSTATAAKFVAERKDKSLAAIASTVNAGLYDMDILQEDIEDDPGNFTRFLVIQSVNQKKSLSGNVKPNMASFIFKTKNEPGSLYRSLGVFAKFNVNLTRLESRPMEGHAWNYWFYADAELSNILSTIDEDVAVYVERLTEELKNTVEDVRLLGIYRKR